MKLIHLKFIFSVSCLFICMNSEGQDGMKDSFESIFSNIANEPTALSYANHLEINNEGGHLQGVQMVDSEFGRFAVMTGSSDSYAYYMVVKLGHVNQVVSVTKLFDKPLKHAGGFQIFQNYMAIGIEDNSAKNKSKVCIYDLSNPEKPTHEPINVLWYFSNRNCDFYFVYRLLHQNIVLFRIAEVHVNSFPYLRNHRR